jgi:hypothetical protein
MNELKPDPLHPTGRQPEGGCCCAGEPDDPPCEFHTPGNGGDELDVTPVDVPTDIDISVRRNMLLIERYKAEVRRLRDRIYSHDGVVECQRADEAEAEVDRLHTANDALRAAAWELLVTTEREVITVSEPGARERFEAAKRGVRDWFCSPSDKKPGKARIEADGGDEDPVEMALYIVDQDAKEAGDFLGRQHAVDLSLAAEVRRLRAMVEAVKIREELGVRELELKDEVRRLREELLRATTTAIGRGTKVRFPDGLVIDRAEHVQLQEQVDTLHECNIALSIERDRLRADNERLEREVDTLAQRIGDLT